MLDKIVLILFGFNSAFLNVFCAEETPPWMNELFGDGTFDEEATQYIEKHLSR